MQFGDWSSDVCSSDLGYQVYFDSPTNQQFFILSNDKIEELKQKVKFAVWEKYDNQDRKSVV